MKDWIENPFKAVLAGTALVVCVAGVLAPGIGTVGILV